MRAGGHGSSIGTSIRKTRWICNTSTLVVNAKSCAKTHWDKKKREKNTSKVFRFQIHGLTQGQSIPAARMSDIS